MIHGILETALYVDDLEKAVQFYQKLFDFPVIAEDERLVALSVNGKNVLLLFPKDKCQSALPTPGGVI